MANTPNGNDLQSLVEISVPRWRGCDWDTAFGRSKLNLRGMRPHQARLLAEATSGDEAKDWDAATGWLLTVERDAKEARSLAIHSISLFQSGRIAEAAMALKEALLLESKHRDPVAWVDLYEVVVSASQIH